MMYTDHCTLYPIRGCSHEEFGAGLTVVPLIAEASTAPSFENKSLPSQMLYANPSTMCRSTYG